MFDMTGIRRQITFSEQKPIIISGDIYPLRIIETRFNFISVLYNRPRKSIEKTNKRVILLS